MPGGLHREWCDAEMLRLIRRKSLAELRREVEPVEQHTLARFLTHWQGVLMPRRAGANLDALLDAIESLQGAPLTASLLESCDIARAHCGVCAGRPRYADCGGRSGVGGRGADRRARWTHCALSRRQTAAAGAATAADVEPLTEREEKLLAVLESAGASFFDPLHQALGGGYPGETIEALWSLVWRGLITNDSLHALRAYIARPENARTPRRTQTGVVFRSRRTTPPTAQGRWSVLPIRAQKRTEPAPTATEASHALALQLLNRYGVLLREQVAAENVPGGF